MRGRERVRVQILIQYMWFEDIKERKREREKHKVQGRWHSCVEYAQYHIHVHPFYLSHVGFTLTLIQVHIVHTCMIILVEYQERSTKKTLQGLYNNLIAFLCNFIARPANMCTHYKCTCVFHVTHVLHAITYRCSDMKGKG